MRLYRVPAESGEKGESEMERWFEGKSATETSDGRVLYIKDDRPGLFARSLTGDPTANPEERLVEDIKGPTRVLCAGGERRLLHGTEFVWRLRGTALLRLRAGKERGGRAQVDYRPGELPDRHARRQPAALHAESEGRNRSDSHPVPVTSVSRLRLGVPRPCQVTAPAQMRDLRPHGEPRASSPKACVGDESRLAKGSNR